MKQILAAVIGFMLSAGTVWGAAERPPAQSKIVDTAFVAAAQKRGAIIWDTRSAAEYRKEHIAGSINIGDVGAALRDENTEDYLPLPVLEKVLGGAGIDPAKEIVVYGGKGNPFVYFALVTLEYFGAKSAYVYHGGIDDWKAAGLPVTSQPSTPSPVAFKLNVNPGVTVSTQEVIQRLKNPDVQIVDVRTPREYSGDDIRAIRGGHIPGAVNIPYEQNWADPETPKKLASRETASTAGLALKAQDQLKALYGRLNPDKETIVYCQSGVRASETATVLKSLGFKDVKVYDSSWLGYGSTLEAPAEDVKFFNVGLLNGKLAAMQRRIEALEKQLAEALAGK